MQESLTRPMGAAATFSMAMNCSPWVNLSASVKMLGSASNHFSQVPQARSIELSAPDRVDRIVRSGLYQGEKLLAERIAARLPPEVTERLFGPG